MSQRKTLFLRGNITDVKRYGKVTQTKAFINLWTSRFAVLFYFSVEGTEGAKVVRCNGRCTGDSSCSEHLQVCGIVKNPVEILCYVCVKADELLGSTT